MKINEKNLNRQDSVLLPLLEDVLREIGYCCDINPNGVLDDRRVSCIKLIRYEDHFQRIINSDLINTFEYFEIDTKISNVLTEKHELAKAMKKECPENLKIRRILRDATDCAYSLMRTYVPRSTPLDRITDNFLVNIFNTSICLGGTAFLINDMTHAQIEFPSLKGLGLYEAYILGSAGLLGLASINYIKLTNKLEEKLFSLQRKEKGLGDNNIHL